MNVKYNVDTKLIFQIGDPLDHGTANFVHNGMYALAYVNAIGTCVTVKKGNLPQFIQACKVLNVEGFDITTPHKTDIIQYLDECDEASRLFKCVNHTKFVDGKLVGIGLDGIGMGGAILNRLGDSLAGRKTVILGAGAVAGPIAAFLCEHGVKEFVIANRTIEKAEYIAEALKKLYGDVKVTTGPLSDEFLVKSTRDFELAVQCTTLSSPEGAGVEKPWGFVNNLASNALAADVSYPVTPFLTAASEVGLELLDGKAMLACQQMAMIDFHFGIKLPDSLLPEVEEILDVATAMRIARDNRIANNQQ